MPCGHGSHESFLPHGSPWPGRAGQGSTSERSCHTNSHSFYSSTPRLTLGTQPPPPGVALLLLVTSGHVSLHNYGTPLESAVAHCEPYAGLWPTQPPLLLLHPIRGTGWMPEPVPHEVDTHTPKQRLALPPLSKGLRCCISTALPYLSTQHWACGLPPCTDATIKGK